MCPHTANKMSPSHRILPFICKLFMQIIQTANKICNIIPMPHPDLIQLSSKHCCKSPPINCFLLSFMNSRLQPKLSCPKEMPDNPCAMQQPARPQQQRGQPRRPLLG